ncbi:MAG: N-acetyl-gamma-glutamyl-phosphate reductase [Rikenellaceae bacterium]|nr:N-acetyl-gamma-glutamyl-phosphate reductase [Rikenellaceae bacterium]MBR2332767.1 N-acetyl-gamma-glutamyl-phosphate reductase [Rikenellaceae bacterium]
MIGAAIIGGAGYTGGEAIRLLLNHPAAQLRFVQSTSNAGNLLSDVHSDLFGDTSMRFVAEPDFDGVDVVFLCVGHGDARKYLESHDIPSSVKVIDLSQDFRLAATSSIGERQFVYGLPEVNYDAIAGASNIANPGCFATCLQLGMLPLAAAGVLTDDVQITATTGSTGAGQRPSATTHFSWRNNNLSHYKAFTHQHLNEIGETITRLQPSFGGAINFVPLRGAFARGIFATIYTRTDLTEAQAVELYKEYYRDAVFTHVSDKAIDMKQVVNTNKCLINVVKHGDQLLVSSTIDNLVKGASGQAVQNMNIMMGVEQSAGLRLKPSGF